MTHNEIRPKSPEHRSSSGPEGEVLRHRLIRRAQIVRELRRALDERGYLEVETPSRVRSPGIDVNLEAFSSDGRFLITSPEFHMKRLLAAGHMRLYQICRCFRQGEITDLHNPEFSMLEFYAAGLTLDAMMQELEQILWTTCVRVEAREIQHRGISCSLQPPWQRLSVHDAFLQHAGWSPLDHFDEDRFYFDLVDKVDRHLGAPRATILHGYPAPLAMLAALDPLDRRRAKRFEVYVAGIEIANAFEELIDSSEQRQRFEADLRRRQKEGKLLYPLDEQFLEALQYMPPCSGVAVGLDRLVMLLLGADRVQEVMAFPEERL